MQPIEVFDKASFDFDLKSLPDENIVNFNGDKNIEIFTVKGTKIVLDFLNFSYELNGIVRTFSPFHINFDFIEEEIKDIYIPLFLKEKFIRAQAQKRIEEVKEAKEHVKSTYNVLINNYE